MELYSPEVMRDSMLLASLASPDNLARFVSGSVDDRKGNGCCSRQSESYLQPKVRKIEKKIKDCRSNII